MRGLRYWPTWCQPMSSTSFKEGELREGKRIDKSTMYWPDDLEWLDAEAARRGGVRSDIIAELIALARGRAQDDDMVEMLVTRLEAIEGHVRRIRATVGTECQLPYMPDGKKPTTWAERKVLIDKMTERLGGNGTEHRDEG